MTATIRPVGRRRDEVTDDQAQRLKFAESGAETARTYYMRVVVDVLNEGASFAEVAKATGLSTNTLQRWKREMGR